MQEKSDDESLEKDQSAEAKEGDKANSSKRKTVSLFQSFLNKSTFL